MMIGQANSMPLLFINIEFNTGPAHDLFWTTHIHHMSMFNCTGNELAVNHHFIYLSGEYRQVTWEIINPERKELNNIFDKN